MPCYCGHRLLEHGLVSEMCLYCSCTKYRENDEGLFGAGL